VPRPVAPSAPATGEQTADGTDGRAASDGTQCTP
jgi:hypothetical protein